jgi:hypothetical protein
VVCLRLQVEQNVFAQLIHEYCCVTWYHCCRIYSTVSDCFVCCSQDDGEEDGDGDENEDDGHGDEGNYHVDQRVQASSWSITPSPPRRNSSCQRCKYFVVRIV